MSAIVSLAEKLGLLNAIKYRLTPDPIAARLVDELKGLLAPYSAINTVLSEFLDLRITGDRAEEKTLRRVINEAEGGALRFLVIDMEMRCSTIMNIFQRDLKDWFLDPEGQRDLSIIRHVFEELATFHDDTIKEVEDLVSWLHDNAVATYRTFASGHYKDADNMILQCRDEISEQRKAIVTSMERVLRLEDKFRQASKAV